MTVPFFNLPVSIFHKTVYQTTSHAPYKRLKIMLH